MKDITPSGYSELLIEIKQRIGGFSSSNLWRARLFYETYADHPKLAPLMREIAWSQNILIFEKCRDYLEREFYITATKKFGWR